MSGVIKSSVYLELHVGLHPLDVCRAAEKMATEIDLDRLCERHAERLEMAAQVIRERLAGARP